MVNTLIEKTINEDEPRGSNQQSKLKVFFTDDTNLMSLVGLFACFYFIFKRLGNRRFQSTAFSFPGTPQVFETKLSNKALLH